ncbi:hypothetical protein DL769_003003 [Monosporascus sp. CRB-8-3]|nr:hypothetical protein DL769_003003 [Monosporascus sp. CRB-8-3]
MPPRTRKTGAAAAAQPPPPPPPPLDGCVIALSGTIPGRTQASIEKDLILPLGATLAKSVTASTTHLVTTEPDYNKPSAKVKSAKSNNVPIVNFQWLEECLGQMTRVDENNYGLEAPAAPSSAAAPSAAPPSAPPKTNSSRKRKAAQMEDDDDVDSKPEKSKPVPEQHKAGGPKEARVAEGQVAKSLDVRIPVDEGANRELVNYEVYINDDGLIYDASLNQTNASNNNNKFYRLQLLRSVSGQYRTWTRWGRVGEYGQSKALGDGSLQTALREFESKFKSKSGLAWADRGQPPKPGKYAFIERSYEPDSEDEDDDAGTNGVKDEPDEEQPASKLPKATQELMELIFNQQYFAATMAHLNYDSDKLPLGKLSKTTITRGFQALKDLSDLLDDPTLAQSKYQAQYPQAAEQLSNLFYTIIPHSFGRNRPPVIRDQTMLKKEIELLESLGDMKDASLLMKSDKKDIERINMLDRQFQCLGMNEMTPLSNTSKEFRELKDYLMNTRGATHSANYQIAQIFRIERQGEHDRFEQSAFSGPPRDRRLLWHGSRCTNFGGILSQGLRIAPPEAPVSGYMFGKGIYLADMSSKSANYCVPYISNGHALLLLCEAELGKPMQEFTDANYNAGEDAKGKGMWSTWGKGMTGPSKWKDAACVHESLKGVMMPDTTVQPGPTGVPNAYLQYNEYICYDVSQVRLRYLLRVRM